MMELRQVVLDRIDTSFSEYLGRLMKHDLLLGSVYDALLVDRA